jgi:hypothetical protein
MNSSTGSQSCAFVKEKAMVFSKEGGGIPTLM